MSVMIQCAAVAAIVSEDGKVVVKTSSPIGAPFQRYSPAPFETKEATQHPNLRFSRDGWEILLFVDQPQGRLVWNLPWPPSREVPARLPLYGWTPVFTWLPDNRHIILSLQDKQDDEQQHLWIADVDSGARRPITSGTTSELDPALSPDGKKHLFTQLRVDYTLETVSLENATVERVLSSELQADMPAWATRREQFADGSRRNGPPEIWCAERDATNWL